MRRYFESLRPADVSAIHSVPDGIFLVRVDRAQYRWHKQKLINHLELSTLPQISQLHHRVPPSSCRSATLTFLFLED
jgi:hypothetical protein